MAGAFDGLGHFLLIFVGSASYAAGQNLTLLVDELEQEVGVFVINIFYAEFFEAAIFFALGFDSYRGEIFDLGLVCHDAVFFGFWLQKNYHSAAWVCSAAACLAARFFSLYATACLSSDTVRKRSRRSSRL